MPVPDSADTVDAILDGSDAEKYSALAKLEPAAYDRLRQSVATRMGIRLGTLDFEVERLRSPQSAAGGFILPDVRQWSDAVDCAELLDSISAELARYMVMSPASRDAVALWTLMTFVAQAVFIIPLLLITSPQKRCGKSSLLILLRKLCHRPALASNMSAAVLFRMVDIHKPTLLLDEVDAWCKENNELRGVLNCGHSKETAHVWRCDGDALEPRVFDTFTPKAIAGINAKSMSDTITDRAIVIDLKRCTRGESVQRLRQDRLDLSHLQSMAARWAADHFEQIKNADADVPKSLNDRAADNWRPLLAIADAAGGGWPDRARTAAMALSGGDWDDDDVNVMLLADIREVFQARGDRMTNQDLCQALAGLEERPWGAWNRGREAITVRQLARRLGTFGIATRTLREGEATHKGYDVSAFADAFSRYLKKDDLPVTLSQPLENKAEGADSDRNRGLRCDDSYRHTSHGVTNQIVEFPEKNSPCDDVTIQNPENGVLEL